MCLGLAVGLRAGAPLPTQRTRPFVAVEGKGPTSQAVLPLPCLFPPGRHTLQACKSQASRPLLPREAPGSVERALSWATGDLPLVLLLWTQSPHLLNG